jgi:TolA-binding protein
MTPFGRLRRRCPAGWKLTRAISEGMDSRVERHLAGCGPCSAEYQALLALARQVETDFPAPENMARGPRNAIGARLRVATLSLRPQPVRRTLLWLSLPVAGVAVIAVLVLVSRLRTLPLSQGGARIAPAPLAGSRASIRAIGPARFVRAQSQPDEIVRVDDGEIELEIAPLHANERFRVVTEDGEVEVRGTSFKVAVFNHSLAAVHVWRGRVEVRSRDGAFAVLEAGDDWVRATAKNPSPVGAPATKPAGVPSPLEKPAVRAHSRGATAVMAVMPQPPLSRRAKAGSLARATVEPGALEPLAPGDARSPTGAASFGHAWAALRRGEAKAAAAEFGEVQRLSRGRDIEEDAFYWHAVAIARAGDPTRARQLFGDFLDRFPTSSRIGEAADALGWLLLQSGQRRSARRAFERAVLDPSPRVQANAREGLRRTQEEDP